MKNFLFQAAKRAFRTAGLDVRRLSYSTSEFTVLRNIFRLATPSAVIDVGANAGQYAIALREAGFRGKIISFEPLESVHAELSRNAAADPSWIVAPRMALSDEAGETIINVAENSVSSSLLPANAAVIQAAPEVTPVRQQTVATRRLDSPEVARLLPPDGELLLKVDTQGYEKKVIEGSTNLLPRIVAIQAELSLIPLYDGAPAWLEIIRLLADRGFEVFSLTDGFKDLRSGRLLQMDGFFLRQSIL